jgi:hypothetical protein
MKKYIWKNKDHDQIIEVEGILGRGPDDRVYLKVKGTETGIPLDECVEAVVNPVAKSSKPVKSSIRLIK